MNWLQPLSAVVWESLESTVGKRAFVEVQISRGKYLGHERSKEGLLCSSGGPVVKNPPCNGGNTSFHCKNPPCDGGNTGQGTKIPAEQLDPGATTTEPTWHS